MTDAPDPNELYGATARGCQAIVHETVHTCPYFDQCRAIILWSYRQGIKPADDRAQPICCVKNSEVDKRSAEIYKLTGAAVRPAPRQLDGYRGTLTPQQVYQIRWRYNAGGVTQAGLGAEFGVTGPTISAVVRGVGAYANI